MKVCEVDDYSMCGIQRVLAPAWVSQRWQGGHYSQDSVRGQDGMIGLFSQHTILGSLLDDSQLLAEDIPSCMACKVKALHYVEIYLPCSSNLSPFVGACYARCWLQCWGGRSEQTGTFPALVDSVSAWARQTLKKKSLLDYGLHKGRVLCILCSLPDPQHSIWH